MRTKISKVAKDLNVGINTAVEFLRKHNIEIGENPDPNTRIDDNAVQILTKEFSKDKETKAVSDTYSSARKEDRREKAAKNERQRPAEIKTEIPGKRGPVILGKIDLDSHGQRPAAQADPARAAAKETAPQTAAAETPAPPAAEPAKPIAAEKPVEKALAPEVKATGKPLREEPRKEESAPAEKKEQQVTEKTEKPAAEKPAEPKPAKAAPAAPAVDAPKEEPAKEDEPKSNVFRYAPTPAGPELKVVGKIDLSSINQSTRPRKKSRSERRAEAARAHAAENGDRKKRKRIGKEKVDIEKAASQPGFGNDARKKDRGADNRGQQQGHGDSKRKRDRRPVKPEVNSEDVQKQVKETLARLTNKATKKSAKWRKEKREEMHNRELENQQREAEESKVIKITEFVTANDLANLMDIPVNNVIATCMNLGVMVSINQRLDAETINIVAEEFGFSTEFVSADVTEAIETVEDNEEDLQSRPPIVTVMGHVDHGKTSLLDYIRKANVIAGEAGGITQHIGAYNVKLSDGRRITFLDTPGHEAFTAMRARGAKVTDLAIIIVAADDDVMPQTIEAINHASAAGVPMVFAINKIDKPAANPDKIKEELANMNYLVEEWGGKYQSQDISAKKGIGVEELMDKVLLEAELLDLKANPDRKAIGSVIESSLDKGRGYVATVLVQNGTLRVGDVILAGTHFGKVKAMFNERNQRVAEAGPAAPVLILGLNGAPQAGDTFNVLETEQEAREIAAKREQLQRELGLRTKKRLGLEELGRRRALNDFHELNLVVKGDVDGSVEALSDSLLKLSTPEVQVNVLHKGVGAISESDVTLAAASDAIIIGFQVRPSAAAKREAEKEGVEIRLYSVIYKAIEEVKDAMEGMLSPEIREEITGTAEVLQTYHISKVGTIAGAIVRDGKVKRSSKVRVIRDGIVIYTGELGSLKRFKDDVKEVISGYDCGLSVQGYNDIREGDIIEAFEEVEVKKTL